VIARIYQGNEEGNGVFLRGFEEEQRRISDGGERAETDGVFFAVATTSMGKITIARAWASGSSSAATAF